jgi:hypothetical protein
MLPLLLPGADAAEPRRLDRFVPVALAAIGLVSSTLLAFAVHGAARWLAVAVGLIAVSAAGSVAWLERRRLALRSDRALVIDGNGLSIARAGGRIEPLMPLSPAFGLSALASAGRNLVVLAVTSSERVVCVGARTGGSASRFASLLARAVTVPTDDLVQATMQPDGEQLLVGPGSLLRLARTLLRIDPHALDRCYLSDANGAAVVLEAGILRVGRATIDLEQPLEWRATTFQEDAGEAQASFQATWVRQGSLQVAFVSLLSADARSSMDDVMRSPRARLDSGLVRDARLLEVRFAPPPPRETRVAVDRLFMLPLRRALDRSRFARYQSIPDDASAS